MPTVTTSSSTGSRVLQKHQVGGETGARTPRDSQSRSSIEMNSGNTASKTSQETPAKRSSTTSNMSSKIKRFPLLSRKESRSKGDTTSPNGSSSIPRSISGNDSRRKSTSSSISRPTESDVSTPSHVRSVSLASAAPSSLPRPIGSPPGLPSSATAPNLAEIASQTPTRQQGASVLSPYQAALTGASPKRVPAPGSDSGIPRLVKSPRSPEDAAPAVSPIQHTSNGHESRSSSVDSARDQTPTRELSDNNAAHDPVTSTDVAPIPRDSSHDEQSVTNADSHLNTSAVTESPTSGSISLPAGNESISSSADRISQTSSTSRVPATITASTKPAAAQTGTSPNGSVPAIWRSNSYEGSAQASLTDTQGTRESLAALSGQQVAHTRLANTVSSHSDFNRLSRQTLVGFEGLKSLEHNEAVIKNKAILTRVELLHQLVLLRGESVLDGVNVSEIVWSKGTDAYLSMEEEFSRARNGKAIPQHEEPAIRPAEDPQTLQSTVPPPKKHGIFDRVTARFGHGSKTGHPDAASVTSHTESTSAVSDTVGVSSPTPSQNSSDAASNKRGPVFGVGLQEIPPLAMAISIIGGQRHQLPILVFSLVEAIFKRGLDTSGIFRMNGNAASVQKLVDCYNKWPSYGDDYNTEEETIFTLCEVLKKYLRELPEPLLHGALWTVFVYGCLADRGLSDESEHYKRMAAVQIIFRLLPRKNMSLLIYLIAFLYQMSLRPANRLTTESISVIFGPSLLGVPRTDKSHTGGISSPKTSSEGLRWLLENWEDSLSQDLLDEEYDCFASPYVGQTAWSTPNILGEAQTDPMATYTASLPVTTEDESRETKHVPDEASMSTRGGTALDNPPTPVLVDYSPSSPEPKTAGTHNVEVIGVADGGDDDGQALEHTPLAQVSSSTDQPSNGFLLHDNGAPGTIIAAKSRSVSGFARGENILDDDISTDPNAAQLFGSLSQLFTSERKKVNAYQHEVKQLTQEKQNLEASLASLQVALSQSQSQSARLEAQVTVLLGKVQQLEQASADSDKITRQQESMLDEAKRELDQQRELHVAELHHREELYRTFEMQHRQALEDQSRRHDDELQERLAVTQREHRQELERHLQEQQQRHEKTVRDLQLHSEEDMARLSAEITQLREAVQTSDKERDGARTHLQRIRALLDAANQ